MTDKDYAEILKGLAVPIHAESAMDRAIDLLEQEPCEDAISRQAVLEMAYDMSEIDGEHFTEPCMVVDIEDIQKLQPVNQKPKTGHWISVSERLPEEYGEYLITWTTSSSKKPFISICECEETLVYDYEHNRFKVEWLFDDYIKDYPDVEVIAWMPLPDPYKAESEE